MFKHVVARMLLGLGIVCLFAGLVTEARASITSNQYCWQTSYARCGYHPCTCEASTEAFGCSTALTHGPTGWCYSGGSLSCSAPTVHCGKKVNYIPPKNCRNCDGVITTVNCDKSHNCSQF